MNYNLIFLSTAEYVEKQTVGAFCFLIDRKSFKYMFVWAVSLLEGRIFNLFELIFVRLHKFIYPAAGPGSSRGGTWLVVFAGVSGGLSEGPTRGPACSVGTCQSRGKRSLVHLSSSFNSQAHRCGWKQWLWLTAFIAVEYSHWFYWLLFISCMHQIKYLICKTVLCLTSLNCQ